MAKNEGPKPEGSLDPAMLVLAGMSEDRWAQFVRLEALKIATADGARHGKAAPHCIADAVGLNAYVIKGDVPKSPQG